MNAEESPLPTALSDESGNTEERTPRPGRALAGLALLVALAALAGSAWLWWSDFRDRGAEAARQAAAASRYDRIESEVDQRVSDLESRLDSLAAEDAGDLAALQRQVQSMQPEVRQAAQAGSEAAALARTLQSSLEGTNARLAALESRFDALAARGFDGGTELDLAELDYLLRLAQERLQLFLDIRTADRALELAAEHVAALDNPVYSGLQREIAAARGELAAVDMPDPATLDRELDAVQQRIATLPFEGSEALGSRGESDAGETGAGAGWWARLKSALSGLVTVRRTSGEVRDLPALADQELIRQRAWLEVERVRLAAMRHDQPAYEAAIERARETIERWFAPRHRGTRAALQALQSAAAMDVEPELPDISGPLVALRALRVNQETTLPEATGEPAEPADDAAPVQPVPQQDDGSAAEREVAP